MQRTILALAIAAAAATTACRHAGPPPPPPVTATAPGSTLYQRIGGYDALAAAVDGLLGRMLADPELGPFFTGMSRASQIELREHLVGLLCEMAGGPCRYIGRDIRAAHEGLGITAAQWGRTVDHLRAVLDGLGVEGRERDELLAAVALLEEEIVERP